MEKRSIDLLTNGGLLSVLDVGSGTGFDCWSFMIHFGEGTKITGVDSSKIMIEEATIRYGVKYPQINFITASVEHLPFKNNTYSATHCERLLCHLPSPNTAIEEIIRVTKPGGRVVVTEADYGTTIIHSDLLALTERLVNLLCISITNHRIGRQLSGTLAANGLKDIVIETNNLVFRSLNEFDRASGLISSLESAVEKGVLTNNEKTAWLEDQRNKDEKGQFFASTTFFTVAGNV
ncbi:methyltransferase domain-containing protein [Vibrio algarum]|uniref:Methyltransferase domain-containing protein n=1 Tax=Vibrio algarum TaxID=3020714 RepID=A0ABT4YQG3_9VIBR|nr:methyltransferase domain-containing protein [Vibrio sp. KJ40-1]MDB1123804.1 methyltransferase domain-containing protein [Vibrio sp. KJ40-1]